MDLLSSRLLTVISVPALNKWTKVAPCVRHVAVLQNFCGLVAAACQLLIPPPEESSEEEDEGQAVGVPLDESKAWRKLARQRVRKACHFLSDKESSWMTSLWCVLTKPIMRVHFSLFKHATWLSERVEENETNEEEGPEQGSCEEVEEELRPKSVACFCKASLSPALKALEAISQLAHLPQSVAWDPVVLAFGPVLSWKQQRLRTTRRTLCMIIGQCWRKLVYPFQQYPWALALLVDPEAPAAEKFECVQDLFSCRDCQLDAFARQLRERVPEHAMLEADTVKFLEAVLQRVVPTSTFIERVFARLSQWATVRTGKKPKLSSIAAKHLNCRFTQTTQLWRKRALKQQTKPKENLKRPLWSRSRTKGKGSNGWHLFCQDHMLQNLDGTFQQRSRAAQVAWANTSAEEKKRYSRLAQAKNITSSVAAIQDFAEQEAGQAVPCGSPCNIGTLEGFPLARHIVAGRQREFRAMSRDFDAGRNNLEPDNDDAFVGAPPQPYPLIPSCPKNGCMHSLPDAGSAVVQSLHDRFWFIVKHHAPKPNAVAKEVLLLSLRSDTAGVSKDVAVMFHTRKAPLEAALLVLQRCVLHNLAEQGIAFSLACSGSAEEDMASGKAPFLDLTSDRVLFVELARLASDWTFHFMEVGPVTSLARFDVLAVTAFEESSFEKAAREAAEASTALHALNLLLGQNKKRSAPSQSRPDQVRVAGAKAGKQRKSALSSERALMGFECESEHGSNNSEESEDEGVGHLVGHGASIRPAMADHLDMDPATFANPVPAVGALPPLRLQASHTPGKTSAVVRHRRGEQWGPFSLAPIYSEGVRTGYGAICGLHHNSDDAPGISCRKALTIEELSEEDCRLRLKRWLVAGLNDHHWPEDQGRSMHLSLGGLRLVDFSSGDPEPVLDRQVGA